MNIITAVMYDDQGRITQTMRAPAGVISGRLLEVAEYRPDYDATHYVANGALTLRPRSQMRLLGRRLMNLPAPCRIIINGTPYECNEREATLEFAYPGTYRVVVQAFPFLDSEFEVYQ